jgi:hypothetical protein
MTVFKANMDFEIPIIKRTIREEIEDNDSSSDSDDSDSDGESDGDKSPKKSSEISMQELEKLIILDPNIHGFGNKYLFEK